VWVLFTDFILDPTTRDPLSSTIKAVRCDLALTAAPTSAWIDFRSSETCQTMVVKVRVAHRPAEAK
jgi:hypothetical protein